MIGYGLVSILIHIVSYFITALIVKLFILSIVSRDQILAHTWSGWLFIIAMIGMTLAISCFLMSFFFKHVIPTYYQKSENKLAWFKSAIWLITPFEILRFIISMIKTGKFLMASWHFAFVPSYIFENTYLVKSGRHNEIYNEGLRITKDYLAYSACYVIYAIIFIALILFIFRYLWNKEKELKDKVISEAPSS